MLFARLLGELHTIHPTAGRTGAYLLGSRMNKNSYSPGRCVNSLGPFENPGKVCYGSKFCAYHFLESSSITLFFLFSESKIASFFIIYSFAESFGSYNITGLHFMQRIALALENINNFSKTC